MAYWWVPLCYSYFKFLCTLASERRCKQRLHFYSIWPSALNLRTITFGILIGRITLKLYLKRSSSLLNNGDSMSTPSVICDYFLISCPQYLLVSKTEWAPTSSTSLKLDTGYSTSEYGVIWLVSPPMLGCYKVTLRQGTFN